MDRRPSNGHSDGPKFTLDDVELDDPGIHSAAFERQGLASGAGPRSDAAVFNLDLEYGDDDEDALLDWEQYAGLRKVRLCGREFSMPSWARLRPPDWWWAYTKRQRRLLLTGGCCCLSFAVILLALVAAAATGHSVLPGLIGKADSEACAWVEARLPTTVVPVHYDLELDVEMSGPYSVNGSVTVYTNVTRPTKCIVVHAKPGLGVRGAWLGNSSDQGNPKALLRDRPVAEQLILQFPTTIKAGKGVPFTFVFGYYLAEGLSGLYRSTYTLLDGANASLAATQFEATSARAAFPCFDEPALKASFSLSVRVADGYQVLSNMPVRAVHHHHHEEHEHEEHEHEEHDNKPAIASWHFEPTPAMSSYLLAIVIGNLTAVTRSVPSTVDGAPARNVSVWGTPNRQKTLEYAADVAASVLPALETAFGVPYPLPKLDLAAIPDFSAGAMENWGLITFRETALLVSDTTSTSARRYVAQIIAHEMVHLWFGDLVTMAWWNELWLNEGFASYFEYLGAQAAKPQYHYFTTFYTDNLPTALDTDALRSSHALSSDGSSVATSDAIESQFDAIEYEKGAALLRMLRAWLNRATKGGLTALERLEGVSPKDDPMLQALQVYLKHAYNATTAEDLWADLSIKEVPDLAARMRRWTYGAGFPLVLASVNENGAVWLQQGLFRRTEILPCDPSEAFWVPVAMARAAAPSVQLWTEFSGCQSPHAVAQISPDDDTDWIKVNAGQTGLFRVQYDETLWKRLLAAATGALPALDLAGLIEDAWALSAAGQQPITTFLELVAAMAARPTADLEPWSAALPYLSDIYARVPCNVLWQNYLSQTLFPSVVKKGGANSELFSFARPPQESTPITQKLLRPRVLEAAGYFGSLDVTTEALALMEPANDSSVIRVDPDARAALLETAVHAGHRDVYDRVKTMYLKAEEADEKLRLLRALSMSGASAMETLDWALGPDVRAQDLATVVYRVASKSRPDGPELTWQWLEKHWDAVHGKYGGNTEASRRVGSIMEDVASLFTNETAIPVVQSLFQAHEAHIRTSVYLDRSVEVIKANSDWVSKHGDQLCSWVAQHAKLKP